MREKAQYFDPRQVMQKDSFEVFHYREPRPTGVEVHHHDFYEIYYLLDGQVDYWVDGKVLHMQPGDLLLINPQELHRPLVGVEKNNYERIVLWINRDFLENMASANGELVRCFNSGDPNHSNLIRPAAPERSTLTVRMSELVREFYGSEYGSDQAAYGLFLQLMVHINRMAQRTQKQQGETGQLSALVQKTLQYIADHLAEPITLDILADLFYVSKYHLSHTFTKETGISIYRYILLRRLLMARQQLLAGEPAGQVSRNCGFSDYTSFYRAFKSEYGISPGAFSD